MSISQQQQKIWHFIHQFMQENHFPPTIREIARGAGLSSTSVASYHLGILEEKGFIKRDRNRSRGLRLLVTPGGVKATDNLIPVPLIGRIAAGEPMLLPPSASDFRILGDETIEVARSNLRYTDNIFAVEVRGDSMIDALVNDGDIVILRYQNDAENGDMVAALLRESNETTLKHFYLEGNQVRLQPANPTMQPIYVDADKVTVQGKVILVIRRFGSTRPRSGTTVG